MQVGRLDAKTRVHNSLGRLALNPERLLEGVCATGRVWGGQVFFVAGRTGGALGFRMLWVWRWTALVFRVGSGFRVLLGGSWYLVTSYNGTYNPNYNYIGALKGLISTVIIGY